MAVVLAVTHCLASLLSAMQYHACTSLLCPSPSVSSAVMLCFGGVAELESLSCTMNLEMKYCKIHHLVIAQL